MISTAEPGRRDTGESDPKILLPCIDPADVDAVAESLGPARSRLRVFVDEQRIGPDRAYMRLWNAHAGDVILWHADMVPVEPQTWFEQLLGFVERYPDAGIFGCKLLYPVELDGRRLVQSAGGYIDGKRGVPLHFGGGVDLFAEGGCTIDKTAEVDRGQYEEPRRVQWVTFGGCYIRRRVLDAVGDMDPNYRFSYYSDVDYCLTAASLGFDTYYLPVPILHCEGRDNKKRDDIQAIMQGNRAYFLSKWGPLLSRQRSARGVWGCLRTLRGLLRRAEPGAQSP
jgi:GT2 family glycosyltransferase